MHAKPERQSRGPVLVAIVASADEASEALAAGADALDPQGTAAARAIRARHPDAPCWPAGSRSGQPGPVDCDQGAGSVAAAVAVAAVSTWRGAPAIRTRHVPAVRRAVDMTTAIRGDRLPASTRRGLA
ncbi:MAG: hypothetical protein J2P34_01325 [Actinobacteria bacterium]|nr:hypothetical protein [Actinomycetota bacterium]